MKKKKTIVIGLTGSIGMGKSTVLKMFKDFGAATLDADAVVHDLMTNNKSVVTQIRKIFPAAWNGKAIDREALFKTAFVSDANIKRLESILHPAVFKACRQFTKDQSKRGTSVVVLDVPLLFETGYDRQCDYTVCVSAPVPVQKARVLKRKNMSPAKLKAVLKKQMPSREKMKRADYVIDTGSTPAQTRRQVRQLISQLEEENA